MHLLNRSSWSRKTGRRKLAKGVRRKADRRTRLGIELLETRNLLATVTFQQGLGNYASQEDTVLYSRTPDVNSGTEGSISPDQQDANGVRQGLVKFGDIFGNGPGQIPLGATINEATLIVSVVNPSFSSMQMSLYRMQQDWSESTATWNSFGKIGGVQASEGEASDLPPDALLLEPRTSLAAPATAGRFDVTTSLEYWAAGAPNFGWLFESAATDGWDFRTKESAQTQRPMLIVKYDDPPAAPADYQILNTTVTHAEGTGGDTTAIIEVARLGDISAAASINYTVTAGGPNPAGAGDFDDEPVAQPLNFGAGEAYATIEIMVTGDDELEGFETFLVTLTGGDVVSGRDVATVTIGDDDALINEVLANITNAEDETDREYIELIGTRNESLDGYYFVVFEGQEQGGPGENGAPAGVADFVVDLSPYSFGDNGLLVLAPTNWEYEPLADGLTEIVHLAALDGAGGVLEDSSQTYALIRSPITAIMQGTDYDTVGTFESAANFAIGGTLLNPGDPAPRYGDLVGDLDQLPAGAQIVDSVFVVEGGGGDRDRAAAVPGPSDDNARPGVHVHQPTGLTGSSGVTSDAVSRRAGQTLPNSIGAWFNGDINDGDPSSGLIRYLEDTFFVSVVAPDGSVLTPGAANILRNVFFQVEDQDAEVAEAAGSITLQIERTGDIANEQIDVTYRTVDIGSAEEDADYAGVEQIVTFMPGEESKDITIMILPDDDAEGFEEFRIDIIDVSDPSYLITNGRSSVGTGPGEPAIVNGQATVTIADADVLSKSFQNGVSGYNGTFDAYIDGESTTLKFGQDPVIRVDQVKGEGEDTPDVVRPQQGLLRFDNMFGNGADQVPMGATIFDAFLTLNVTNVASGADLRFFRMLQNWEEVNATWIDPQGSMGSAITNGVTPDNSEAASLPDFSVPDSVSGQAGIVEIRLNVDTVQAWANGALDNFGWSIINDLGSLWSFNSSEAFAVGTFKPKLTILYTNPEVDMENVTGSFGFSVDNYVVNEGVGTATVTVNRIGGFGEPANVTWTATPGTGDLTDITGADSGMITFDEDDLFKTFEVAINDDASLERTETLNLTLSGVELEFERSMATLTIRDDDFLASGADLLLNEIWINSPGNDPPHEFVELIGDASIGLGSLYYVAIEGLVGDHEGTAEKVVDLGAYFNGSNGLSIVTPDAADFAFRVPAETTQIDLLGSIANENVASENDSTTYMLIYSPLVDLTLTAFDYDWNNSGTLGLLSLPGVEVIDSVGVNVVDVDDQIYGPGTNRLQFGLEDTNPDVDAITRARGNTQANRGDAWYGGDLAEAGDDYLLYDPAEAFDLPVTGTAMSPGELNTGDDVASPLVSLTDVMVNGSSSVTLTFSDSVSQLNLGNLSSLSPHGAGITITDIDGEPIPTVDAIPTVAGLGTDTLTLTFTGSGVVGGQLPEGIYRLNFVGNGLIANGRAVDVTNDDTEIDAFRTVQFQVGAATLIGDYNGDNRVDAGDYVRWRNNLGGAATALLNRDPANLATTVDATHYADWKSNYGNTLSPPGAGGIAAAGVPGGDSSSATTATVSDEPTLAPVAAPAALDEVLTDLAALRTTFASASGSHAMGAAKVGQPVGDDLLLLLATAADDGTGSDQQEDGEFSSTDSWLDEVDGLFTELGESLGNLELACAT